MILLSPVAAPRMSNHYAMPLCDTFRQAILAADETALRTAWSTLAEADFSAVRQEMFGGDEKVSRDHEKWFFGHFSAQTRADQKAIEENAKVEVTWPSWRVYHALNFLLGQPHKQEDLDPWIERLAPQDAAFALRFLHVGDELVLPATAGGTALFEKLLSCAASPGESAAIVIAKAIRVDNLPLAKNTHAQFHKQEGFLSALGPAVAEAVLKEMSGDGQPAVLVWLMGTVRADPIPFIRGRLIKESPAFADALGKYLTPHQWPQVKALWADSEVWERIRQTPAECMPLTWAFTQAMERQAKVGDLSSSELPDRRGRPRP